MTNQLANIKKNLNTLLEQNPATNEINLETCSLTSLNPILPLLTRFKNLKVLRLQNNELTELPPDLSGLSTVQYLDLTQNKFSDLEKVMSGLFSLKNLKHLFIDLSDEDEDEIIITLTSLESFNGTPLTDVPDELEIGVGDENNILNVKGNSTSAHQLISPNKSRIFLDEENEVVKKVFYQIDFAIQEKFYSDTQKFLNQESNWELFSDSVKVDLKTSLLNDLSSTRQQAEIISCKRHLTNDCFDAIISSINDEAFSDILRKVREVYDVLIDESYNVLNKVSQDSEDTINKLKNDLHQADSEIGQLLEAAEVLEKEASDSEVAKRKLGETLESEKDKLSEELGWMLAEKEKLKNKLHQYQITQQRMSTQANLTTRELLVQSLQNERKKKNTVVTSSPSKVGKHLTLRQIKEIIEDIYNSKTKFDRKCSENKLPRETMEQHLYTYLNQKYGLKNLILDWASSIIAAVKKYSIEDNYVCVFGKILRNEIDEEFRFVQKQLTETVGELLKVYLKGKYPLKLDADINAMLQDRMNGQINEEEWVDIIKYMYNKEDSVNVIVNVKEAIRRYNQYNKSSNDGSQSARKRGTGSSSQNRIPYNDFVKVLLDFQLNGHKRFLKKFVKLFRMFDQDKNGILNELECKQLLLAINPLRNEEEIDELLTMMDPYNNQQITFSECVTFLSAELVRMMNNHRNQKQNEEDEDREDGFDDKYLESEYGEDEEE